MPHRTPPNPRRTLRLATARFNPDRITSDAPSDRVVATDEPVRELEPGVHRLLKLAYVFAPRCFLQ
jgi:hypothetical protein